MTERREFTVAQKLAIAVRETDSSGRIHCQGCGIWLKSRNDYEIHHIVEERMRPIGDKERKLTTADGMVLCLVCHPRETKQGAADMAQAKRREAADLGLERPGKQKLRKAEKKERRPLRVANGKPQIARRYGL